MSRRLGEACSLAMARGGRNIRQEPANGVAARYPPNTSLGPMSSKVDARHPDGADKEDHRGLNHSSHPCFPNCDRGEKAQHAEHQGSLKSMAAGESQAPVVMGYPHQRLRRRSWSVHQQLHQRAQREENQRQDDSLGLGLTAQP